MVDQDHAARRSAAANEALTTLHRMGVSLSIDDYGTGYSSLAHVRGLPVSCVKIDRSFVSGMLVDPKSATIVRSTIELARDLGIGVVAEGAETSEEWEALEELLRTHPWRSAARRASSFARSPSFAFA
jgi:EAL domain-containing protein (putative c-di-GMP-specific phosphodiesterase class I)